MALLHAVSQAVGDALHASFDFRHSRSIGGGCIHKASVVEDQGRRFFVKVNDASCTAMFDAEADGLRALGATRTIRVPEVVAAGVAGGAAFLVLEYLDLSGRPQPAAMGRGLVALHRCTADTFGWPRDNYIGATLQINGNDADWPHFFAARRLRPQLEWARQNGANRRLYDEGMRLAQHVGAFFSGHQPPPSLLHGDLWGGNAACLPDGTPVIFDPAAYRGDREADLAMTELFGGFGAGFRAAYEEAWPLDPGYDTRKVLYNLYHILNHFNLFGGGYAHQAESTVQRLLAELRG